MTGGDGNAGYYYWNTNNSYTIVKAGSYVLDTDVDTRNTFAIEISASNVTLDGNGHTLTDFNLESGVLIDSGASGVTVENFAKISGFTWGIYSSGTDATITNNTLEKNDFGIYSHGSNASITDNTASNNTVMVIYSLGNSVKITDNEVNYNQAGIVSYADNATITNNSANNNENTGIKLSGSNDNVSGNTANNNGNSGIELYTYKTTITGNTANNNTNYGIYSSGKYATIIKNFAIRLIF